MHVLWTLTLNVINGLKYKPSDSHQECTDEPQLPNCSTKSLRLNQEKNAIYMHKHPHQMDQLHHNYEELPITSKLAVQTKQNCNKEH